MPRDRDFKRLIRRRMRKTGESYSAARAALQRPAGPRPGRVSRMHAFERFTVHAKRALALAQREADAAGGSVEAVHLLFGLLHVRDGLASAIVQGLGADPDQLQRSLRAGPAAATAAVTTAGPTPEVGRAIELAFKESWLMGHGFVGTEHLLLGVLAAAPGPAAALADAGVTPASARDWIRASRMERVQIERSRLPAEGRMPASGSLDRTSVQSLLHLAANARATGTLTLHPAGASAVALHFLFGQLFHAEGGGVTGDDAVLSALALRKGGFEFDARSRLPHGNTVRSSIGNLVERAGGPAEAPAAAGAWPARPSHASELSWTLDEAVRRARKEGSPVVRLDHVLLAAAAHPQGAAMLRALGADVAGAVRLAPPERLAALHLAIREQQARRERALTAADYEISAAADVAELAARRSLAEALRAWVASWAAPPGG